MLLAVEFRIAVSSPPSSQKLGIIPQLFPCCAMTNRQYAAAACTRIRHTPNSPQEYADVRGALVRCAACAVCPYAHGTHVCAPARHAVQIQSIAPKEPSPTLQSWSLSAGFATCTESRQTKHSQPFFEYFDCNVARALLQLL